MPGPVFFNTSPACLRQPDERCRPACTNRLPAYMVRLVRLCSRHRLLTELALDTHTHFPGPLAWGRVPALFSLSSLHAHARADQQ